MKKIALFAVLAAASLVSACTDASKAKFGALGDSARVICHSGGKVIFDDFSTGKVQNEESSDGYYFVARSTNRLVQTSGECNLDYGAKVPAGFQPIFPGNTASAPAAG